MLYRELVNFDPIESVIQLRSADRKDLAADLVRSYVISDRMADVLVQVVLPQLQIDQPVDNKGVLVVGNYGTGKSHLMSMLSALAEHADLVSLVRQENVRAAAVVIGGRFQVARGEIGGVRRSLRDIVLDQLERFFERVGTPYRFPPDTQVSNNKDLLIEAMAGFSARYPHQGVLFVLDELLDYLRSREERELILDLGFLREIGEVTSVTPFRFIAGVQETLFDNPRFAFVAEQLRRVRDRFEQVRIARDDIAYVVAHRLLNKSDAQLARITEHLRRFAPLYPPMADRLGEYARLFPIHPAYIDTFERVYIAEKREVLQTFSRAMQSVLDQPVPDDQTGLISYDQYWDVLRNNAALRTLPGVADVVQKSDILLSRIETGFDPKRLQYQPMARRIIHALSVHRLTSELDVPLGVTTEELRDQLCLWMPLPEPDADFLAGAVRTALDVTMRTVNGQYISSNPENGQYYLDLKKDIDFDARIAERGEFTEERDLNRYFYDALQRLLNITTSTYVTNFRIWPYELVWDEHKVTRPGYLFLTSPRERSTAQPPRDFYLYFLPPFDPPAGRITGAGDEVIFSLHGQGQDFRDLVRKYAGAQGMATDSPANREVYAAKAVQYREALVNWLRQYLVTHLRVTHQGITQTVSQVLAQTRSSASRDPEALIHVVAAYLLEPHFRQQYPEYPTFARLSSPVTETNRANHAREATHFLARGTRTNLAIGVLSGLRLLDAEEHMRTTDSPYATYFANLLSAKAESQVVNRGEVLTRVAGGVDKPVYKDPRFQLEPEWVTVALLALVYEGRISLSYGGTDVLDASTIERAALKSVEQLTDFQFYRRPREMPLVVWQEIFEGFGLNPALVKDESTRDQAVRELQTVVNAELVQVAERLSKVQSGLSIWNTPIFTDNLAYTVQAGLVTEMERPEVSLSVTEILPVIRRTKEFLEQLTRFNSAGKMRQLTLASDEVRKALAARQRALQFGKLLSIVADLQPQTTYLATASAHLQPNDPWVAQATQAQQALLADVRRAAKGEMAFDTARWLARLSELKRTYRETYTALHQQYVLGPQESDRRDHLLHDRRYSQLLAMSRIDIFSGSVQELTTWREAVETIPACPNFHAQLLEETPACPYCRFQPIQLTSQISATSRLNQLDEQLGLILKRWHAALHSNLENDTARASRQSMTTLERRVLDQYVALADPIEQPIQSELVEAANQALRGLQMVTLQVSTLIDALKAGGFPCTQQQLLDRFTQYLADAMRGHDQRNTRLALDVDVAGTDRSALFVADSPGAYEMAPVEHRATYE